MEPNDLEGLRTDLARLGVTRDHVHQVLADRRTHSRRPGWRTAFAVAVAACLALGLAVGPSLLGMWRTSAVALGPAPALSFPFALEGIPEDMRGPIFERDGTSQSIRYEGSPDDRITLTVGEEEAWTLETSTREVKAGGVEARVIENIERAIVVWESGEHWIGLSGQGAWAEVDQLKTLVGGVVAEEQAVRLPLTLAPVGWQVNAYKDGRTLSVGDGEGRSVVLTMAPAAADFVAGYGVEGVDDVKVGSRTGRLGVQDDGTWVLETTSPRGNAFSLLADPDLGRDQVLEMAAAVRDWQ